MSYTLTVKPDDVKSFAWEGDDKFELIEEGEFTQDYKYQNATNIYKELSTGRMFALDISRSGSPFTDWYYDLEDQDTLDLYEVEKVEVVSHKWKEIK